MRIPMISDTEFEIIGQRSGIVGQLSERSDALQLVLRGCPNWVKFFPLSSKVFFGAEGDECPWRSYGVGRCPRRADQAIPKRGSADMSRSAERQFAAHVVRLGPVWGWPGLRSHPHGT